MTKFVIIFMAFIAAVSIPFGSHGQQPAEKASLTANTVGPQPGQVKVTIAATTSLLGPATSTYHRGDQIPITITMANTSAEAVTVCLSSDLYQNLPKLMKDGKEVPYLEWQSEERVTAAHNRTCEQENLPSPLLLKPNAQEVADWFVLSDGPTSIGQEGWYGALPVGKYELSIQRRLTCCDGPLVESNRVSFEIVP
jgi:hypothetical protein